MPSDALSVLQASTTKTGTFNSAGLNIKGTPTRGVFARILYSAAATSSGAGSAVFRVTESDDGTNYSGISQPTESSLVLSTTPIAGEIFIPVNTQKPYIRLELATLTGTGATVTYQADIVLSKP